MLNVKIKKGALTALLCVVLCITGCGGKSEDVKENGGSRTEKKNLVITTEDKGRTEKNGAAAPVQEFQAQAEKLAADFPGGGECAVYVYGLVSGREASVNNKPMQSASLIKLFIAAAVLEQKEQAEAQGSGSETDALLKAMITVSDNEAANILVKRLGAGDAAAGMNAVNAFAVAHGFADTHMGRLMLDFDAQDDNYTSVKDCGIFLQRLYRQQLAGAEQLTGLMKEQTRTGKIPAGVPAGTVTANKTGELDTVENDAALIWGEEEPYILCVMSEGLADAAAARDGIQKLSSALYELMRSEAP